MAHLTKRLERLEGKRGAAGVGPSVVFFCDAETGEARAALIVGGGHMTREGDETSEAFMARAEDSATRRVFMPDNGRDAIGRKA